MVKNYVSHKHLCSVCLFFVPARTLTHFVIDGCVDDLVSRNVAVGLCRLSPADLSDSPTDDIEGQTSRFTRRWRKKRNREQF